MNMTPFPLAAAISVLMLSLCYVETTVFKRDASSECKPTQEPDYDFIVVGAGAGGCVVANRLTEVEEWSVLLVEAGGEESSNAQVPAYIHYVSESGSETDWGYKTKAVPYNCNGTGCEFYRGKVLGGSTSTSYLNYLRGLPDDYERWEEHGSDGWGYENMLKYFVKSENNNDEHLTSTRYHGKGGYQDVETLKYQDVNAMAILKALKEYGLEERDLNGAGAEGVAVMQTTTHDGERRSANTAYLKPVADRENLNILIKATVTKVLIDEAERKAYGVEINIYGEVYCATAREVILSAGAINTPQILQLSGIGPEEFLEPLGIPVIEGLPVGYNLYDAVSVFGGVKFKLTNTSTIPTQEQRYKDLVQYIRSVEGPLTGTGVVQIGSYVRSPYSHSECIPDLGFFFASVADGVDAASYYDHVSVVAAVLRPKSRGYVKIVSTDPFVAPEIHPNYLSHEDDLRLLVHALKVGLAFYKNTTTLKDIGFELVTEPVYGCGDYQWGTDEYWHCCIRVLSSTMYQPAGSCKMGSYYDVHAVVDPRLNVYRMHNLRVIDASVFPTPVSGSNLAAEMAVGEKGADIIKEDYGV